MTRAKEFDWADHFDACKRIGIKGKYEMDLYRAMVGGIWEDRDGERNYHAPDPDCAVALYTAVHSRKLEEAARAAGFGDATVEQLIEGKILPQTLGLELK